MTRWFKKSNAAKTRIPGPIALLKQALVSYAQNWWLLLRVTAIVAIPYSLIGLTSGDTGTNVLAAYGSFAALIMNLALIWTVTQLSGRQAVTVKEVYYNGTSATVKFLLVTMVLILQLIPFAIGALLFSRATVGATTAVTLPEFTLVGLLWVLLSVPSLYWLNRYVLSIFAVTEPEITPIQALRASRAAVQGRSFKVLGRLVSISVILLITTLLPTVAILLWLPSRLTVFGLAALQILISISFLPILYIYLHKLYLSISK